MATERWMKEAWDGLSQTETRLAGVLQGRMGEGDSTSQRATPVHEATDPFFFQYSHKI